jgi:hypothetical protein
MPSLLLSNDTVSPRNRQAPPIRIIAVQITSDNLIAGLHTYAYEKGFPFRLSINMCATTFINILKQSFG